jgi:hypothetical protein
VNDLLHKIGYFSLESFKECSIDVLKQIKLFVIALKGGYGKLNFRFNELMVPSLHSC